MANQENQIQYQPRRANLQSPEEARKNGKKGGIASGKARRTRHAIRDLLSDLLPRDITDSELYAMMQNAGIAPTYENAIALSMIREALKGDVAAARFIRDTLGEMPQLQVGLAPSGIPVKDMDLIKLSDDELRAMVARIEQQTEENQMPSS